MIDFIDLTHLDSHEQTHLSVSTQDPALRIGGALPHGTRITPATIADAYKLIRWLEAWCNAQLLAAADEGLR